MPLKHKIFRRVPSGLTLLSGFLFYKRIRTSLSQFGIMRKILLQCCPFQIFDSFKQFSSLHTKSKVAKRWGSKGAFHERCMSKFKIRRKIMRCKAARPLWPIYLIEASEFLYEKGVAKNLSERQPLS